MQTSSFKLVWAVFIFALFFQPVPVGSGAALAPMQMPEHKDNYFLETTLGHPTLWFSKDMPIKVLFKQPKDVLNYQPYQQEVFKECLKEYERVSAGKIKFAVVEKPPYDIVVNFSYQLPVGANVYDAGWTTVQNSPHHIDRACITIMTRNKSWLEKETLSEICLHEIGHAVGMHNHSPDPHDVMYPICTVIPQKLSIRDVNTLSMLYDFKPSDQVLANLPEYCEHISETVPRYLSQTQAQDYCAKLSSRLNLTNWIAAGTEPRTCDISLLLDGQGNIHNYRITRRSGSVAFDNSMLSALVTSIPLPKPADGILSKGPSGARRIALAFTCSSDGKIVSLPVPADQCADLVPCAQAPAAQPLYTDLKSGATTTAPPLNATAPEVDVLEWASKVKQLAKNHWQPDEPGNVVLLLGIKQDGQIAHLGIKSSLADVAFEKAAIDSCILAEPYPKPPGDGQFVKELEINFDGSNNP